MDSAYDNLVAEMDRVLSRRTYISYNDDHNITQSSIPQQNYPTCTGNEIPFFSNVKSLRRDINSISREAAESSTEMVRCIGEINKAKAALGSKSTLKKKF